MLKLVDSEMNSVVKSTTCQVQNRSVSASRLVESESSSIQKNEVKNKAPRQTKNFETTYLFICFFLWC